MTNKILIPPNSNPALKEQMMALISLAIELYQPEKVVVFGSQSRGDWKDSSDVDLLIVEPAVSQVAGIMHVETFKRRIRIKFDAVVAKSETIETHKSDPTSVYARALSEEFIAYQK